MAKIIVSTTFREFTGTENDRMQINFLKSLKKQTMQDFKLVVTIFGEHKVERVVQHYLPGRCAFVYDGVSEGYKFSLTKTFLNGVDYGMRHGASLLLDCSSDVTLAGNFLAIVCKRCGPMEAGISHPNIFLEPKEGGGKEYCLGKLSLGIDARFFSLDLFRDEHVYLLPKHFPSFDYGAGIEQELCGIAIKYAKKCHNIFMESKILKCENDRGGASGKISAFMREGFTRNLPIVKAFFRSEGMSEDMLNLIEVNKCFKITRRKFQYYQMFWKTYIANELWKYGIVNERE